VSSRHSGWVGGNGMLKEVLEEVVQKGTPWRFHQSVNDCCSQINPGRVCCWCADGQQDYRRKVQAEDEVQR